MLQSVEVIGAEHRDSWINAMGKVFVCAKVASP